jgi:hypothetical protein
MVETAWTAADCSSGGWSYEQCQVCGTTGHGYNTPALGHDIVDTEVSHGNCSEYTVITHICSRCGLEEPETSYKEVNDHDWVPGKSDLEWSDEAGDFITYDIEYCSRCGIRK